MRTRYLALLTSFTVVMLASAPGGRLVGASPAEIPSKLTDQEFWKLIADVSEPEASFPAANIVSNEVVFSRVVPDLLAVAPGGVYVGVGPEQNFTYIAATKPRIAFVTDNHRGNLHLHLLYKALFELSADRTEFFSRLFTKTAPAGLARSATGEELFQAFWSVRTDAATVYTANLEAALRQLTTVHAFPLSAEDRDAISRVYYMFYWFGPSISNAAATSMAVPVAMRGPNYRDLLVQNDAAGHGLTFMASEEKFSIVKDLESRNLIVPIVAGFSGSKGLRAIGTFVRSHDATVTAFYVSNVEAYLTGTGTWNAFCSNVASMPVDRASVFIRPGTSVSDTPRASEPLASSLSNVAMLLRGLEIRRPSVYPIASAVANCAR